MTFFEGYILSVAASATIALIELYTRLRHDARTTAEYPKLTWGELAMGTVVVLIPAANVIFYMWFPLSRAWDVAERLLSKWDKPIIRAKEPK